VSPLLERFYRGEVGVDTLLEAWLVERSGELADAISTLPILELDDFVTRIKSTLWNESWTFDETAMKARAHAFVPFTREIEAWRTRPADPRVGRAALRAIWCSDAENWYRGDQVAHIVPQPKVDPTPSFADHAFALIEAHASTDTPDALDAMAERLLVEAACNEAQMASDLRDLAERIRTRFTR
jgi:hypothetical protein